MLSISDPIVYSPNRIDSLLTAFTHRFVDNSPGYKQSHLFKEIIKSVRSAFASLWADIYQEYDSLLITDDQLKKNIQYLNSQIHKNLNLVVQSQLYIYGVWLFTNPDFERLQIGDVLFLSRTIWLKNLYDDGKISRITYSRILSHWNNNKKLRKRKPSRDSEDERDIIDAVGTCPSVCLVECTQLSFEAGKAKSILAARIALLGIALIWQYPSRKLEHFHIEYDNRLGKKTVLCSNKFGFGRYGALTGLPGWSLSFEEKSDVFGKESFLKALAPIVNMCTNSNYKTNNQDIYSQLFHALVWFESACKEDLPVVAISKFVSSLDSLSGGKKTQGITKLICYVWNLPNDKDLIKNHITVQEFIHLIYGKIRSRSLHGNNDEILSDWSGYKGLVEIIASGCLRVILHELARTSDTHSIDSLIEKIAKE